MNSTSPSAVSPLLQKCFDESYMLLMPEIEKRINNVSLLFEVTVSANMGAPKNAPLRSIRIRSIIVEAQQLATYLTDAKRVASR
uniref:Uncharacterized protein n=1 Tax=Caenorhabditis japonica TaxID=281687 RepID=A0A8R1IPH3_CAEJA